MEVNELNSNAFGGTELIAKRLEESLNKDLLSNFQIIHSRVRNLDETKFRIFVAHDLPEDDESKFLANEGWKKFHCLIFVSYHQLNRYIQKYKIPFSMCIVLPNSIVPIEITEEQIEEKFKQEKIKLIYTSTPHRGLELLVNVFAELCKKYDNLELDVYSSFKLYGWEEQDKQFQSVFDFMNNHEKINNHGTVSNDEIREKLKETQIFAYPSIWEETSCLCLIEAMSAGNICVHSSLGALPETSSKATYQYNFTENVNHHCMLLYNSLDLVISNLVNYTQFAKLAKFRSDMEHNQYIIHKEWESLLTGIMNANPSKAIITNNGFNLKLV